MNGNQPVLLLRVDADVDIGCGHLMRCIALAEAWRRMGGQVTCLSRRLNHALRARLQSTSIDFMEISAAVGSTDDADATRQVAHQIAADWIVLDGYRFDEAFQRAIDIHDDHFRVMLVDDSATPTSAVADLLLNQNTFANSRLYPNLSAERLLLGPRFAMLREEFRPTNIQQEHEPDIADVPVLDQRPHNDPRYLGGSGLA